MEQKKNSNNRSDRETDGNMGVAVHSQVKKIKQEQKEEKIRYPSLKQLEMKRALREINRQRSCSPLGLSDRRISAGN
ncbi:hypothetical protein RJ641_012123 [Dillenia turbinata]|uniref:Uncharacterized protein n=1 Tax=Dillenia turbinata TaxID=194707 RepID=A0AAN8Z1Y6_9MAGN